MADSVDTISKFSGLPREDLLAIWNDVKGNHARLNSCAYHEFELLEGGQLLKRKYRCKHCAGVVDGFAYHWHEEGRRPKT